MDFIAGSSTLTCAKEFLSRESNEIALAVAYWGNDAEKRLDIPKWAARQVRILCDATSGSCNPKALDMLMKKFGSHLKTNPRLHAKVYWTPSKVLITSANASGSGLAVDGKESESNIEAGVISGSPELIRDVKEWFDGVYQSPGSIVVDKTILEFAKKLWALRPGPQGIFSLTEALRSPELISERNIWVTNFQYTDRSIDEVKRHKDLKMKWRQNREPPPEAVNADIIFTKIEDIAEDDEAELDNYKWKSWMIDLADNVPHFWFVPNRKRILKNEASHTVPLYGTKSISFGGIGGIRIGADDVKLLRQRWSKLQGSKNARWVPLEEFAIKK